MAADASHARGRKTTGPRDAFFLNALHSFGGRRSRTPFFVAASHLLYFCVCLVRYDTDVFVFIFRKPERPVTQRSTDVTKDVVEPD